MTNKIKCCTYLVQDNYYPTPNLDKVNIEYKNFFLNKPKFCDVGDDPSFYCSKKYDSNISWGVCRHNVRQCLKIGDEIHFIACYKIASHFWKYYYVGFGIVYETITHRDILVKKEYSLYKKYFNNLIKPLSNKYVHYESLPINFWHNDWKMRISSKRTNKELTEVEEDIGHDICGITKKRKMNTSKIGNKFPFGNNYIIFDRNKSFFNISNPILVAEVDWDDIELYTKWTSKSIQLLFSNNKLRKSFTHLRKQHPTFNLHKENAVKLKKLITK